MAIINCASKNEIDLQEETTAMHGGQHYIA